MTLHRPRRPTWECAACSQPWPCPPARGRYLAEYDGARASLGLAMAGWMTDAMTDLPHEPAGELYTRFLGWIRHRDAP